MEVRNIIFDLGNVILDIDTELSKKAFGELGLKNFDKLYSLVYQSKIFDKLELGRISPLEFYEELRNITKTSLSDNQIKTSWNALIKDYNIERIDFLIKAKQNFRTFILSNTNQIHYEYYTDLLKSKYNISGLESLVEKAYFSHIIGLKKPDLAAFNFIIQDTGIKTEETLFIDDCLHHIKAAEKLGIKTIWLSDNKKLEDIII